MRDLMQDGVHFGESFPGDTKKNLLKPGADKLCFMFRLRPDFHQEIKELPGGHLEVLTGCQIFHIESGQKIAEGVGLATTMESKYRWRNASKKCPHCGKETIKKSKYEDGGYYCYEKIGGCGAKFNGNDREITDQIVGKVENPDIADTYNTVLKMSKKRAYVDATITACAASDIFSQDAEDYKDTAESVAHEAKKEDLRNVTENSQRTGKPREAAPPVDKDREQMVAEYNEIKIIMAHKDPGGFPLFTEDEIKAALRALKDLNGKPQKECLVLHETQRFLYL
jgi:hypothetical protein